MNDNNRAPEFESPESTLETAVQMLLAEPLPEAAILRVVARAKALAQEPSEPTTIVRQVDPPTSVSNYRIKGWLTLAASIAIVFVLISSLTRSTSVAWAEVLNAVRDHAWIHGSTTYSNGHRSATSDFWVSTQFRVAAVRFGKLLQFDDFEKQITSHFDAEQGTIVRLPSLQVQSGALSEMQWPAFLNALVDGSSGAQSLFRGEHIVKTEMTNGVENGQGWIEYLLQIQKDDAEPSVRAVRIRVDARTKLPVLWEERGVGDKVSTTRFDYPNSGPNDIYDLGVPRDTKIVDRLPRGDLARIARTDKADRRQFDNYDAIVVDEVESMKGNLDAQLKNLSIKRVRRSGNNYRVDQLLIPKQSLRPPADDTDLHTWWRNNKDNFWSIPQLICDGQTVFIYQMTDDRIRPQTKPSLSVTLTAKRSVGEPADDPAVTWPELMPEYCCRPHLWLSDINRSFDSTDSVYGSTDTVRVAVGSKRGAWSGDLYRYWFDPSKDYVLLKSESTVFEKDSDKVAFVSQDEFSGFTKSPSGKWYPHKVRHTAADPHNAVAPRLTRFYVTFPDHVAAELFTPIQEK